MLAVHKSLLLILAGVSLATCYCPADKFRAIGDCAFKITCIGTIRDIRLPEKCLESTNNRQAIVKVNLNEAVERFDDTIDTDFLSTITTLKISAQWREATLALLQYTSRLRSLYLIDMGLEKISGTAFYYLEHLEELHLSHNKLNDIEDLFHFEIHPNKLKRLFLAYNKIEEMPSFVFDELSSLKELDLSYNSISDLTEEPFCNLTNLEILRLNNNRIKNLNGAVNNLKNLKHLYLRGNTIQNIDDESLKIIEHLETFDASLNALENIKPVVFSRHWNHFGNYSTCKIILSENYITSVPNGTSEEISSRHVRNLDIRFVEIRTELDISINSITTIEYNAFQSLIGVVSLNLSKNKIIDFIVNANHLADIKYLNLSSNYISHLYYESFSSMKNLQNLDLSYNRLDFIPDMTFSHNNNLKLVNMTYNELEKLESIHITMFHPEGGVLDLSNNALFMLKVPCSEGIRLISLVLHSNNISNPSLIDLSQQTELQMLDMSKNFIAELNISSLLLPHKSLVILDLSFNKIQYIGPSTFYMLKNLNTLRLGHNHLQQIEYGIFNGLSGLNNLDLSYNRIGFLDSQMLTELNSLQVLSVRSNDMNYLDCKSWYGHKYELKIYVDNNNLTCEWLGKTLSDFNKGYSKVKPVVLVTTKDHHSVQGIPCLAARSASLTSHDNTMVDERLLVVSKNILEAVRAQNNLLKFMWHRIYQDEKSRKDLENIL